MAAGQSATDILASAKAELARANALDKSVKSEVPAAPTPPPAPVKHEYSNAPYSLVNRVKKVTGNEPPTGETLSRELKSKKEMVDKAKKALEQ